MINGWLDNCEEKKKAAVSAMFDVIETSFDPELKVKAFEALVKAGQADTKRMEVAIRQQEADDEKRLRYLEILQHLPPGEISKITSGCDESPVD